MTPCIDPKFEQVGIEVFYKKNNGYYITQDFLQSLESRKTGKIKELVHMKLSFKKEKKTWLA